jgi:hypothetical protein
MFFDIGRDQLIALNHTAFPIYPQNTMRGSIEGSAFPQLFTVLLSRPGRKLLCSRSATS